MKNPIEQSLNLPVRITSSKIGNTLSKLGSEITETATGLLTLKCKNTKCGQERLVSSTTRDLVTKASTDFQFKCNSCKNRVCGSGAEKTPRKDFEPAKLSKRSLKIIIESIQRNHKDEDISQCLGSEYFKDGQTLGFLEYRKKPVEEKLLADAISDDISIEEPEETRIADEDFDILKEYKDDISDDSQNEEPNINNDFIKQSNKKQPFKCEFLSDKMVLVDGEE